MSEMQCSDSGGEQTHPTVDHAFLIHTFNKTLSKSPKNSVWQQFRDMEAAGGH